MSDDGMTVKPPAAPAVAVAQQPAQPARPQTQAPARAADAGQAEARARGHRSRGEAARKLPEARQPLAEFHVDDASGRMVCSVRDAATGDLIRQIPNEKSCAWPSWRRRNDRARERARLTTGATRQWQAFKQAASVRARHQQPRDPARHRQRIALGADPAPRGRGDHEDLRTRHAQGRVERVQGRAHAAAQSRCVLGAQGDVLEHHAFTVSASSKAAGQL